AGINRCGLQSFLSDRAVCSCARSVALLIERFRTRPPGTDIPAGLASNRSTHDSLHQVRLNGSEKTYSAARIPGALRKLYYLLLLQGQRFGTGKMQGL